MLSIRHLFELGQEAYNMLGKYVINKREEVEQQRQAGNKPAAVDAAQRLQRALSLKTKLASKGTQV
jgi:hypothetical protein